MSNFKILVTTLIFLFLAPLFVGGGIALLRKTHFTAERLIYVALGSGTAILLMNFTSFPRRVYIFFHEVAHMAAAVCFSARVFEFKVRADSGYIKSDKNNIFIRLAPYLFPIICYHLLILHYCTMIYLRYYHEQLEALPLGFFLVGIFYTVTTFYNVKLILQETSDIEKHELMLSFVIILNVYFLTSAGLVYLLFNSEAVLQQFYFLPA